MEQYFALWRRLLQGDFGPSYVQFPTPVMTLIKISLPWTVGLLVTTTVLSWIVGNILGDCCLLQPPPVGTADGEYSDAH